jgi:hypothetical protein
VKVPTFSAKSELVRYVDEVNRLGGSRPAVAAFLPDPPSANPDSDHLSVNSLEVESLAEIGAYHRWRAQSDAGRVALCVHKVHDYIDAGKKCDVTITYDRQLSKFQFLSAAKLQDAFKHRPVAAHNNPVGSPSHSGVEFARVLKEHRAAQFARRLSGKRFHLI